MEGLKMLKELYITNYALIKELTVGFSKGLTVLSGETGAGKSIIVGALGLVLGEKAKTSQIRAGSESCTVEGRFRVENGHEAHEILKRMGVEYKKEEEVVIRRTITISGISKSYINGMQVTVRDLKEVTGTLIDIHGQHEHQSLLNVKNHLDLLDQYGGHDELLVKYRACFKSAEDTERQIEALRMDERERERRMDILRHTISEIDHAALTDGEDQRLEEEYQVLKNYEKLVSAVGNAYELLSGEDISALSQVDAALGELERIRGLSEEIGGLATELEGMRDVVGAVASSLNGYVEGIDYEPGKIDVIQSRIEQIRSLKKKYGDSIADITAYRDECAEELDALSLNEDTISGLMTRLEQQRREAGELAKELSVKRRVAAQTLNENTMSELSYLGMDKAGFCARIAYTESENGWVEMNGKRYELSRRGLDNVEFMLRANQGEPYRPLKDIASGGELSRIMLAIKTVLGTADPVLTFVFDEVDAGIGGKIAWAVGNRLRELSKQKQILCITHQAQIASKGDLNIRVEKVSSDKRAVTQVHLLEGEEKVGEIARMISGKSISEAALRQARQMIEE
ncbi:MAG: DNA repair protein RecN [Spirochaetes bacterium]|nr:DNA repair protein RecN [Spirochaetota bacterium]